MDMPVDAPSPEKNPPRVDIELKQGDVKGVSGLKPGDKVKVVLYGEITEINIREPYSDSPDKYVGRVTLESTRTTISEDASATMSALADEDE